MEWTSKEMEEIKKYWNSNISELTLYKRLNEMNPNRTFKSISRKLENMRLIEGYEKSSETAMSKLRVGYLDIEANNLNGDFGYILTWYIKEAGKNVFEYDVIKKEDIESGNFDKNVLTSLLTSMNNYDVIYAHYGSDRRFDLPFIRTRALKHGLEYLLPSKNQLFIMDTYPIAKNKLKLHSNRLDSISAHLGINVKKTPLNSDIWTRAAVGNKEALEYVAKHNRHDVILLERVHKRLKSIERPVYKSI